MDPQVATASALLAIPLDEPERLFSGDPAALRAEWRTLAARWHPDRRHADPLATEVLQHVNALHGEAERRLTDGSWVRPGAVRLTAIDGRVHELTFRRKATFELGAAYIGEASVTYALPTAERDLFDGAVGTMRALCFADDRMRVQMARSLPGIETILETAQHLYVSIRREPDLILLRDVIDHVGGALDPRHVAWIVGALEHLACYLDWAGLMHGAISPDTVFISPANHSAALLGGWWYARPQGDRLIALPERSLNVLPPSIAARGTAAGAIDLELIRLTAREALGDPGGSRILRDARVPGPFSRWLTHPPGADALEDYRSWEAARTASFGPPRFVDLAIDAGTIYPQTLEEI